MNGSRRAVRSTLGIALAVLAIPASAATDSDAGLARCAAMAAPDLRLACYDALSGRSGTPATAQGPVVTTGSAAPPAAAAPVAAPVASPADSTAGFGLPPAQVHAKPAVPEALSAIVDSITEDRNRTVTVRLDNGQAWTLTEGDMRLRPGDRVTIKHGALGSFMLTTPSKHSYHVKRIQ